MAKNKQAKRTIAMAMAATLSMGMAFTAFADTETVTNPDGSTTTTTVTESGEGTEENPEIKMTVTVHQATDGSTKEVTEEVKEYTEEHENGSTTDVVEKETTVDEDNADGSTLDSTVNRTEKTNKDKYDEKTSESYVEVGEEEQNYTVEDDGSEEGQNEVTVELIPGQTTTAESKEQEVEGDVPEGEDDPEYDYTTTDTVDRVVTAETSETEITITETEAELESVKPVYAPYDTDELYSDSGHFGITNAATWKAIMNELVRMKNDGEITEEEYNALVSSEDGSDYVDGTITYNKDGSVDKARRNDANNFYEMIEDPIMLKAINKVLGEDLAANAPDADYVFIGSGHYSGQWVNQVKVTYAKDEVTGEPLVDENGDYIIESYTTTKGIPINVSGVPVSGVDPEYLASLGDIGDAETLDAVPYTALTEEYKESLGGDLVGVYDQIGGTRASQFMLMDKGGNVVFTHCLDMETGAIKGKWYKIGNLEDNDYYASEDAENHVRSIVMNGYWGTSDVAKEDGTYETGSLSKVKKDLMAAVENGDIPDNVTVSYRGDNGEIITENIKVTEELLAGFTPGEAVDVMQAAIWSYSNGAQGVQDGKDGEILGGAYFGDTIQSIRGSVSHNEKINDVPGMARMKLFYDWLIGLETEEESTTIINEKTFGNASLTIGDKIESSDDGESDTYEASLNFKAEFEVGENDELYVNLTYKDLEGNEQTVRKQLGCAGAEATEGMIVPDADNSYTLTDLALTENKEFTFDLRLEGVQQIKQNAYIFVAEGGIDDSQTMVGMAEGKNTVDISTSVTVKFDVKEDDVVKKVRKWRDEGKIRFDNDDDDPVDPPADPKDPPEVPPTTPEIEISEEDIPLTDLPVTDIPVTDLPEDDVPLVDIVLDEVPLTSAPVNPFMGLSLLSALGLIFTGRRKDD